MDEEVRPLAPDERLEGWVRRRRNFGLEATIEAVRAAAQSPSPRRDFMFANGLPMLEAEYAAMVEKERTRTGLASVIGQHIADVIPEDVYAGRHFGWLGAFGTWHVGIVGDPASWLVRLRESFPQADRIDAFPSRFPLRQLRETAASIETDTDLSAFNVHVDIAGNRVTASLRRADLEHERQAFVDRFSPIAELVPQRRGRPN